MKSAWAIAVALIGFTAASQAYEQGDWVLRVGATTVDPDTKSDNINLPGSLVAQAEVDSDTQLGIIPVYMFTQSWAFAGGPRHTHRRALGIQCRHLVHRYRHHRRNHGESKRRHSRQGQVRRTTRSLGVQHRYRLPVLNSLLVTDYIVVTGPLAPPRTGGAFFCGMFNGDAVAPGSPDASARHGRCGRR
jgi:hypothetical protein